MFKVSPAAALRLLGDRREELRGLIAAAKDLGTTESGHEVQRLCAALNEVETMLTSLIGDDSAKD